MDNHQSSYSRWSWRIALILALFLLWMLLTGRGHSAGCCQPATEQAAAAVPADTSVTEAFSFSATCNEITSAGGTTAATWLAQGDKLKAMLCNDLKAQGDDKNVTLTGEVDSDATKQQKGSDAQAFFGPNITVDNQITVKAAEAAPAPTAAAPSSPAPVKLYFETGKVALQQDGATALAPIVDWLKANANAKAVISGFHDPRGDKARNELLAKNRAKAVREALKAAGVDEARIELRKPQSVDGGSDLNEARRVEVSVE